MGWFTNYNVTS